MKKNPGSGSEIVTMFEVKKLNFVVNSVMRIRDRKIHIQNPGWKHSNPGSGINNMGLNILWEEDTGHNTKATVSLLQP